MPVPVQCDQCFSDFKVKDALVGKKVKCPECSAVIVVQTPRVQAAAETEPDEWESAAPLPSPPRRAAKGAAGKSDKKKTSMAGGNGAGFKFSLEAVHDKRVTLAVLGAFGFTALLGLVWKVPDWLAIFWGGFCLFVMVFAIGWAFCRLMVMDATKALILLIFPIYFLFTPIPELAPPWKLFLKGLVFSIIALVVSMAVVLIKGPPPGH